MARFIETTKLSDEEFLDYLDKDTEKTEIETRLLDLIDEFETNESDLEYYQSRCDDLESTIETLSDFKDTAEHHGFYDRADLGEGEDCVIFCEKIKDPIPRDFLEQIVSDLKTKSCETKDSNEQETIEKHIDFLLLLLRNNPLC